MEVSTDAISSFKDASARLRLSGSWEEEKKYARAVSAMWHEFWISLVTKAG